MPPNKFSLIYYFLLFQSTIIFVYFIWKIILLVLAPKKEVSSDKRGLLDSKLIDIPFSLASPLLLS